MHRLRQSRADEGPKAAAENDGRKLESQPDEQVAPEAEKHTQVRQSRQPGKLLTPQAIAVNASPGREIPSLARFSGDECRQAIESVAGFFAVLASWAAPDKTAGSVSGTLPRNSLEASVWG